MFFQKILILLLISLATLFAGLDVQASESDDDSRSYESSYENEHGMPKMSNDRIPECFETDTTVEGGAPKLSIPEGVASSNAPAVQKKGKETGNKAGEEPVKVSSPSSSSEDKPAQEDDSVDDSKGKESAQEDDTEDAPKEKELAKAVDWKSVRLKFERVSKKYLDNDEVVRRKVGHLLEQFKGEYAGANPSVIDITGLSSRARIHLIQKILDHKVDSLPQGRNFYAKFEALQAKPTQFWTTAISGDRGQYKECVNRIGLTFRIDEFSYALHHRVTPNQPGSGKLYGITGPDVADAYKYLLPQIMPAFEEENVQFMTGFKLLLDYEVARRRVKGDCHPDLPIIYCNAMVLSPIALRAEAFETHLVKVLGGGDRTGGVASLAEISLKRKPTSKGVRQSLAIFNHDDENSGREYTSSEEEDEDADRSTEK